jgi:DNA-binding NarL/FixJ family response regulator
MIRVMLADDHAVVRDGLRVLLEAQSDLEVVGPAANGRQAVRLVDELHPDVVVMDFAMPELNRIEATQQIHDASPSTQVLVLSMHSTTEHIFRALQAGARGYLLKDSAGAEVVDAVRVVHAGRRYLSQKIASTVVDDYISDATARARSTASVRASGRSCNSSSRGNRAPRQRRCCSCRRRPSTRIAVG